MSRKPFHTHTYTHYKVKAKNLKKGDQLSFSGLSLKVKSNKKNDCRERVLQLNTYSGAQKQILVIMPRNLKVTVTKRKYKSYPKNR